MTEPPPRLAGGAPSDHAAAGDLSAVAARARALDLFSSEVLEAR